MNEPRDHDLRRDLAADLLAIEGLDRITDPDYRADAVIRIVHGVAPSACRRALAAEAFKAWVHAWLDNAGVPHDPEPEHTAQHGCRISGRMRHLANRVTAAEAEVKRLDAVIAGLADRVAHEINSLKSPEGDR